MSKILEQISEELQEGNRDEVVTLVKQALDQGFSAGEILNEGLLKGMDVVGEQFRDNEIFVPQVLMSARAMSAGAESLKPHLTGKVAEKKGKICMGTVKGDLHDVGKNIVIMLFEGKGFDVVDLGVDVPAEKFVETAIKENCDIIGCSSLLTTTMPIMGEVVEAAEKAGIRGKVKIMVGGAPVTLDFAQSIRADAYTPDAASAADTALRLIG